MKGMFDIAMIVIMGKDTSMIAAVETADASGECHRPVHPRYIGLLKIAATLYIHWVNKTNRAQLYLN
jgi:hypothetical protein